MDRRQILAGSLAVPAALAAAPALAKRRSLRDQMLGSWKLIEAWTIDKASGARSPWDGRPTPYSGMIAYLANGTMCVHIGTARPASSKDVDQLTTEEKAAAFDSWYGYFGMFDVDEARSEVHHMITGSLQPAETGQTYVRKARLEGNRLILSTVESPELVTYNELTWERI